VLTSFFVPSPQSMRQGLGTSDAVKACFVGMGQSRPSISVLFEILARQPRDDKRLNKRLNAIYPRVRRLLRLEPYKTHTVCTYAFCKANPPDYNGTGDWTGSHHVIISDIGTFESIAQMEEWGGGLNAWRASARHGERTPSFLSLGPSFCDNQDQG
jgi:hypothetical protein